MEWVGLVKPVTQLFSWAVSLFKRQRPTAHQAQHHSPAAVQVTGDVGGDVNIHTGMPGITVDSRPWIQRPRGPKFRMGPGIDIHTSSLLNTFEVTPDFPDIEARWVGAGTNTDWANPMKENRRNRYQMKPASMNPTPPQDEVVFEVRFYLEDGRHGGRWRWGVRQLDKGRWELDTSLTGTGQPKLEDSWGPEEP